MRRVALAAVLLLAACAGRQNVLNPVSPGNRQVNTLFWWMLGVGAAVWALVIVAFLWASLRARRRTREDLEVPVEPVPPEANRRATRIVGGLVALTAIILLVFLIYDFTVGRALAAHPSRALTIEIIGHQWWWEVRYLDPDPQRIVVDANELHLPAGDTVQVKLLSRDVIHSFWVPNIIGKRDLIPGYVSSIFLSPDRPGVYRAQCAEFCGHEHAKMALPVVVHPRDGFSQWLQRARTPAAAPADSLALAGRTVFLAGSCSSCHAITGEPAYASLGPDLTHLASRRTLAAGTLVNTPGNLAGWIVDPQAVKPGALMPANALAPRDLRALLAYLETLK
ncbi:MAG TPA: cytochrome c oxidase subunit II [Gemmatimonadaceae bacterium]|nr:cytochrome c oxidase subunit II [Gemmatimonadaceae bacterium]